MKILSSFTHPQVVPNLYEVFVLLNTKEDILKNVGNRAVLGHQYFFSYYGSQWCPKTAWLQTFFKISSFVFGRTKNSYRFGTTWGWVNDDRIFIFGWTIPLSLMALECWIMFVSTGRLSMPKLEIVFIKMNYVPCENFTMTNIEARRQF